VIHQASPLFNMPRVIHIIPSVRLTFINHNYEVSGSFTVTQAHAHTRTHCHVSAITQHCIQLWPEVWRQSQRGDAKRQRSTTVVFFQRIYL